MYKVVDTWQSRAGGLPAMCTQCHVLVRLRLIVLSCYLYFLCFVVLEAILVVTRFCVAKLCYG